MTYEDIVKQAFLEELGNIYAARGEEVPKFASDPRIDAMLKEARFLQAARDIAVKAKDVVGKAATKVHRKVTPKGRQQAIYERMGVGEVSEKAMKETGMLRRAEQWGRSQKQTPTQRMTAARRASTDPVERSMLQVKGDKASKLKQIQDVEKATEQIGGTSRTKRMIGATVEGGAEHARKHPIGMMINPLGVPIGGAVEGATRQAGREAISAGHKGLGRGLKRHAGKVGTGVEIGALAGMGTAVHAPLSAAGVLGGKISGGVAAAAPALADVAGHAAEPLGHVGKVIAHGAEDIMGMATKKVPALAGKGMAMAKGLGSRILGRAPQMMGA